MKDRIENVIIVGMGALGLLFGERIADSLGTEHLCFLMDHDRKMRHANDRYTINGKQVFFRTAAPDEVTAPADLVIMATKYSGLYEARDLIRPVVDRDTIIVSLLNGISSEEILAEKYPRRQILDCVAIGMDAVREGTSLTYRNIGRLQIGSSQPGQAEYLALLERFLTEAKIPYEVCPDIKRAMWNKFMINVGINQTCMVYGTGYGGATVEGSEALADLEEAMHEVIRLAVAEGIPLEEADCRKNITMLRGLNPDGYPSMQQDAMAKRPSEVELFAGTVISLAKKHGLEVPVNERYYRKIKEMEQALETFEGDCKHDGSDCETV